MKETFSSMTHNNLYLEDDQRSVLSRDEKSDVSSMYDPDVGVSNPNMMRDKRIAELKAKHDFYIVPTFNKYHLREHTAKYKDEFDDALTIYSGGGYISKTRASSTYHKKRKLYSNRPATSINKTRKTRRFNEELDCGSYKSNQPERGFSRTLAQRNPKNMKRSEITNRYQSQPKALENAKSKVTQRIERMTEEEVEKISNQLNDIEPKSHQKTHIRKDVQDLKTKEINNKPKDLSDEGIIDDKTSATQASESKSSQDGIKSRSSQKTTESYIDKLRQELEEERVQRKRLEQEIEKLRKISSDISSKLGIAGKKD
ncbi:unnamed protein product [Moneuplotes crassus]|uniref:Uncharacterized protein n=1 Tax=Euplotes crassus TaxID=5936 RepID=A0AAD1ULW3_EUPCR|nr:unnamed protein product [Moneuplotes crassus]